MAPTAALLSIGDEIVLGQQADTNSRWLADALVALGVMAVQFRTVPDDRAAIAEAMGELAERHDLLISTGGLGPTDDDLTRVALNDVVGAGAALVEDPLAVEWLTAWFQGRARTMSASNRLQALRPAVASLLRNGNGTAPGLAALHGRCRIFCLPGPPREMQPMFAEAVIPVGRELAGPEVIRTAIVRQVGLGESEAADRLGELMHRDGNPQVGTTASGGVVSARIRARGAPAVAEALVQAAVERVHAAWAPYAFSDGSRSLAEELHAVLRAAGSTLATAESCTGGLLASALIEPSGASDVVRGGWVTYSNAMKESQLGVASHLIATHGAVSAEVACAMARGAIARSGASVALATSGIAGPAGGTAEKPVGTVWIALAVASDHEITTDARCFRFTGTRDDVRDRTVRIAMQMLRLRLLGEAHRTLLWQVVDPAPQGSSAATESR